MPGTCFICVMLNVYVERTLIKVRAAEILTSASAIAERQLLLLWRLYLWNSS